MVIRGIDVEHHPEAAALRSRVEVQDAGCSAHEKAAERVFSVNGAVRPQLAIAPGQQQFWRMVNASADSYLDLELDGGVFDIVARDGMPLALHDPQRPIRRADHVLVPPAGRLEAIVTGRTDGGRSALRTRCVDTGPDGDPTSPTILADLDSGRAGTSPQRVPIVDVRPATYQVVDLDKVKAADPHFVMVFSEDKNGFWRLGGRHHGLHRPRHSWHVGVSLPPPQSRGQGDDGEDSVSMTKSRQMLVIAVRYDAAEQKP